MDVSSPMTHFPSRRVTLPLALLTALGGGMDLSAEPGAPIVVRVYDSTAHNSRTRAAAIRTASAIVAEAGVAVEWTDCSRGVAVSACTGLRGPHDLIVRINPSAGSFASAGQLVTDQSRGTLGFAVVDPVVGAGAIAMMFLDRVQPLAQRTGVDPGRLLGRAIAHEVGHLLLGSTAHSRTGLMREMWTDEELQRNRPEDWVFAAPERSLLRTALGRTGSID